ncbi:MAG: hypothetical protein ACREDC_01955 [Bradyrhizobium sp.]
MSNDVATPPSLWDPISAWNGLTPDQQQLFGVVALLTACAFLRWDQPEDHYDIGWESAEFEGLDALECLFRGVFPTDPSRRRPDLSALGVPFCVGCGCTENIIGPTDRYWVTGGMCSVCAHGPTEREGNDE